MNLAQVINKTSITVKISFHSFSHCYRCSSEGVDENGRLWRRSKMMKFAINCYLNKFIGFLLPYWHATQTELVTSSKSYWTIHTTMHLGRVGVNRWIFFSFSTIARFFSFPSIVVFFSLTFYVCANEWEIHWGKNHFAIKGKELNEIRQTNRNRSRSEWATVKNNNRNIDSLKANQYRMTAAKFIIFSVTKFSISCVCVRKWEMKWCHQMMIVRR